MLDTRLRLLVPQQTTFLRMLLVALVVPRLAPDDGTGFGRTILWIFGGAVALAALAQGLRVVAGGRVSYPLIAGLCVAGAMVPLAMLLGVF